MAWEEDDGPIKHKNNFIFSPNYTINFFPFFDIFVNEQFKIKTKTCRFLFYTIKFICLCKIQFQISLLLPIKKIIIIKTLQII